MVVRDFLATWSPAELGLLPAQCRPGRLRDEVDVEALHSALVEEYRGSRATGNELEVLQRLTSFIVRASIRIAELSEASEERSVASSSEPKKSLAPREQ